MKTFAETINELWAALGLPAPEIGPGNAIRLSVDGMDIGLRETADGEHVAIRSVIGELSQDPRVQADQVQWILKVNLGFALESTACLSLERSPTGTAFLIAQSVHNCSAFGSDILMKRIEDIILAVETYYGKLAVASRTAGVAGPGAVREDFTPVPADRHEDAMIFRP